MYLEFEIATLHLRTFDEHAQKCNQIVHVRMCVSIYTQTGRQADRHRTITVALVIVRIICWLNVPFLKFHEKNNFGCD